MGGIKISKNKLSKYLGDLDEPVIIGKGGGMFSKGGLRVIIIGEDNSAVEHFIKWPKAYVIEILNKSYFLLPRCVLRMKDPTIIYYFNNPFPVEFVFQHSNVSALDLYDGPSKAILDEEIKTYLASVFIDSDVVQLGFNNRFMKGIYGYSGLTMKNWLFIGGAILVSILLLLQLSGKVDVIGNLTGAIAGAGAGGG